MTSREHNLSAFENALKVIQEDGKPIDHKGLTPESRLRANFTQFISFRQKYWPAWRYVKIHLLKGILANRETIAEGLPNILPHDDVPSQSRTYQEITNGVISSAASEFCQYVEDLCILTLALGKPGYFAKNLTHFRAGKIKNEIFSWSSRSKEEMCGLMFIPVISNDIDWPDPNIQIAFNDGIDRTINLMLQISVIYQYWYNHYIHYKHGLALALAPFYPTIPNEVVEEKKKSLAGFPVAFDASPLSEVKRHIEFNNLLVMPDISSPDIRWNTHRLSLEGNLLRLVMPPGDTAKDISIDIFISSARLVWQLQDTLIYNYYHQGNPTPELPGHWRCIFPKGEAFEKHGSH